MQSVAIVADKWHQANRALGKLKVQWDNGETAKYSTKGYIAKAAELAAALEPFLATAERLEGRRRVGAPSGRIAPTVTGKPGDS